MAALIPLTSSLLSAHGFRHGFSPRAGGVSTGAFAACNLGRGVGDEPAHVEENRSRFAAAVGYADASLFEVHQVHGRAVHRVHPGGDAAALRHEEGDGLVAPPGAAVGVRSADCVPVLLGDPETRCVAALHAGWRGTALGIVGQGVRALAELSGAPPARLVAALFPHIRVCCFEVSPEVAATLLGVCWESRRLASRPGQARSGRRRTLEIRRVFRRSADAQSGPAATEIRATSFPSRLLAASPDREVVRYAAEPGSASDPTPHVALASILRAQLLAAGLAVDGIDDVPGCTRCNAEHFFSYRRDGQASGRHLGVIVAG